MLTPKRSACLSPSSFPANASLVFRAKKRSALWPARWVFAPILPSVTFISEHDGDVAAWWVGHTVLFQKWPLLSGSGLSCAWAGGQPCSVSPSLPQPTERQGCLLPASGTAGAGKGLAGYAICTGRNSIGVWRKLLRRNRSAGCTLLCSAYNSKGPWGAGFMATRLFSTCLLTSLSPEMALMRTGRESRLRRGGVLAEAGNHNRKPSVAFAAWVRD